MRSVGTLGGGLNRLDPAGRSFARYRRRPEEAGSLPNDIVLAVYQDRAGTLWVGLETGGCCRFEPAAGTFTCYHSPETGLEVVNALYEDLGGRFWLGTFNGGLHLFDRAAGTSRYFTDRHGLPHDTVYSILEDDDGRLWLSTGKGLSVFDPSTETFKSYDHTDGIRGDWFFGGAAASSSGRLYFGGSNGLYTFFPRDIEDIDLVRGAALQRSGEQSPRLPSRSARRRVESGRYAALGGLHPSATGRVHLPGEGGQQRRDLEH